MKIKLAKGVYWDTESSTQSEDARNWIRENVLNKMGMSSGEEGMINPELDAHNRPYKWTLEAESCTIEVVRDYVDKNSASWAMNKDDITITSKQ